MSLSLASVLQDPLQFGDGKRKIDFPYYPKAVNLKIIGPVILNAILKWVQRVIINENKVNNEI